MPLREQFPEGRDQEIQNSRQKCSMRKIKGIFRKPLVFSMAGSWGHVDKRQEMKIEK